MTSRTDHKNGRNFDTDEGVGDELDAGAGRQALEIARFVGLHLRRLVVFGPLFGVVYLIMGFLWYQGVQAERTLEAQTDSQLVLLSQPAPQPELLLEQARGWNTAYEVTLEDRIKRPEDSDLIGRVIDAAESAGLVVIETGTSDDGIATLGNDRYTATPLLLEANGTLNGIERFLHMLETDKFRAFEVQSSMFNADEVGYIITLRGVFYSLPDNYGDVLDSDDSDAPVIPVGPASGPVVGGVAP